MASAEQLKALLRSHLEGDNDRFVQRFPTDGGRSSRHVNDRERP